MKQTFLTIVGFLVLSFGLQPFADASIIVTFVQTSAANSTNISLDVYASADAASISHSVGDYGFTVTLSGAADNIATARVPATASNTQWGGLDSTASSGLTFRGGLNSQGFTADPFNITIGTGLNASTKIGSVSFTALLSQYTVSAVGATTARNLTPGGTGFYTVTSGTSSIPVGMNSTPIIVAVPEPSSIALVGLCLSGLGFGMLRSRTRRVRLR